MKHVCLLNGHWVGVLTCKLSNKVVLIGGSTRIPALTLGIETTGDVFTKLFFPHNTVISTRKSQMCVIIFLGHHAV